MAKELQIDDSYLRRTEKLIPSEALAAFVSFSNVVIAARITPEFQQWFVAGLALFFGIVCLPLVLFAANVRYWPQYLVSFLAFTFWVVAVQYEHLPQFTNEHSVMQVLGSVGLGLVTFMAPLIMRRSD